MKRWVSLLAFLILAAASSANAQTHADSRAQIENFMKNGACSDKIPPYKELNYDECGDVKDSRNNSWWICSGEIDKTNKVVRRFNEWLSKCKAKITRGVPREFFNLSPGKDDAPAAKSAPAGRAAPAAKPAPAAKNDGPRTKDTISMFDDEMRKTLIIRIPAGVRIDSITVRRCITGSRDVDVCEIEWAGRSGWAQSYVLHYYGVSTPQVSKDSGPSSGAGSAQPTKSYTCRYFTPGHPARCRDPGLGEECVFRQVDGKRYEFCNADHYHQTVCDYYGCGSDEFTLTTR